MGGKHGVANIIKAVAVVVEGANVADQLVHNPGMGPFKKIGLAFQLNDELIGLLGLNVLELKEEFGELDAEDKKKVEDFIAKKLDLQDGSAEVKVLEALKILDEGGGLIKKLLDFIKVFKA